MSFVIFTGFGPGPASPVGKDAFQEMGPIDVESYAEPQSFIGPRKLRRVNPYRIVPYSRQNASIVNRVSSADCCAVQWRVRRGVHIAEGIGEWGTTPRWLVTPCRHSSVQE
jgi:hypothetical protein